MKFKEIVASVVNTTKFVLPLGLALLCGCNVEDPKEEIAEIVKRELDHHDWDVKSSAAIQEKVDKIRASIKEQQDKEKGEYEFFLPIWINSTNFSNQPDDFPENIVLAEIGYGGPHPHNTLYGDSFKIREMTDFVDGPEWEDAAVSYGTGKERQLVKSASAKLAYKRTFDVLYEQGCHLWLNLYNAHEEEGQLVLEGHLYITYDAASDRKPLEDYLLEFGAVSQSYKNKEMTRKFFGR